MDTYELFSLYILPLFKIILKTPLFRNTNHKTYISKERCFYKVITRFYFTFIFIVDFLLLPSVANAVILIVFPFAFLCTLTTPFWFTVANLELFDRLYYFDGKIRQVTMDHSLVEELVRAGEIDRSESRNHPQKNIITKAVGVAEDIQPDFFIVDMEEGSSLLLCSDGLTNMVDDEKLEEILSEDCTEEEYAGKCIEEALFYGGLDNIAVVIARNRSGR